MGVLDDAIRQHLELKRAHGADEAELKRKEDEALGPVRREAEPAADPDGAEAPAQEPPAEAPVAEEPAAFTDDEPFAGDEPFGGPPVAEEEPPGVVDSTAEEEAAPAAGEAPPPAGDTPTSGFDALSEDDLEDEPFAEEPAPPPAGDAEDVLEETPEFLQETPEHDRLWFEQKPPRDFDFDDEEK